MRSPCHLLVLSIFFWASNLYGGGPAYSRFGFGDILLYGGGRIDALGGAGIGLAGDHFINRLNPAGIGRITMTSISGGFVYSRYSSSDQSGSGDFSRGDFKGLAFAIPISKDDGIVLAMETTPYSNVNFAVQRTDIQAGIQNTQTFTGSGGLSTLALGLSYSPVEPLAFGTKLQYVFGRTRENTKIEFSDPTLLNSQISKSIFYSGFTGTAGLIYSGLGDMLKIPSLKPLAIGAIVTIPTSLGMDEEDILSTTQSFDTTRIGAAGSVRLPLAAGVGISYVFSGRYLLLGDFYTQQWSSANFRPIPGVEYQNSSRIGLGLEVMPQKETDSYFKRVAYRLGVYYNSTYLKVNNHSIDEMFVTAGLGLPIAPDARLNVGFDVGTRGTTADGLQKDMIYRLSVSLSAGETWFLKLEED